jgi:peptidoglycan/xylan/chitin deacetylase (PgdA/CDA1 family)
MKGGRRDFPAKPGRMAALFLTLLVLGSCRTLNRSAREMALPRGAVIFSFDDGPNSRDQTTARLLDVLKKYEVQAFFALLGENARHNPELVRRMHREGHRIVNHGYSDRFALFMGEAEFYRNLIRGETAIQDALGEGPSGEKLPGDNPGPRFYRPQGGFYTPRQEQIWQGAGYRLVPGSVRLYDAALPARNPRQTAARILRLIEQQGAGIILLHDGRDSWTRMEKALTRRPGGPYDRSWIPGVVEETILLLESRGYLLRGFPLPPALTPEDASR